MRDHRTKWGVVFCAVLIVWLRAPSSHSQPDEDPSAEATPEQITFFHQEVEPILVGRCLRCHGPDRKSGLDLRTRAMALEGGEDGPAIYPGDPDESPVFINTLIEMMPPDEKLKDEQIFVLERWIAEGAYYPEEPLDLFAFSTDRRGGYDWWSLQPIGDFDPPDLATSGKQAGLAESWNQTPIDRFVFDKLREKGLEPSPPASPRALIRRATYDLIGLPPTPEQIADFLRANEEETGSADRVGEAAYGVLIDRLLASPRYGEHWGRHWLDVVRFGESSGFEQNFLIDDLWPYRDYVIKSFNDDKPFDQFTIEQIAGDAIGEGDREVEVGMGFLVCGAFDTVGNQDAVQAAQIRANTVDEIIRATSETFLGLTVGCARCHDHKFDPISQRDYYSFYATFTGVSHGSRVVASEDEKRDREEKIKPARELSKKYSKAKEHAEHAIMERAEAKIEQYEAPWTRPKIDRTGTEETFDAVEARYVRLVAEGRDTDPNSRTGYNIDEFEAWSAGPDSRNVAASELGAVAEGKSRSAEDFADAYQAKLTNDGKFGESWLAQGAELTIKFARPEIIDRVLFSSDRPGALGDNPVAAFLSEYRIEVSLDGEDWTRVADSLDRAPVNDRHRRKRLIELERSAWDRMMIAALDEQIGSARREMSAVPGLPSFRVGSLTQPKSPTHVFDRGDPQRKGDEVVASSIKAVGRAAGDYAMPNNAAERERRLALAEWIIGDGNPLTPRVLANRIWHYHFGSGIVATPSDFGFMGGAPSHPELLDWLARELIEPSYGADANGEAGQRWRVKRIHKMIMMSRAYGQSTTFRAEAARLDGESRLLWRYPPRRLTGEQIRDTMLSVAGKLDTRMGGKGFRLYKYLSDNVSTYRPLDSLGPETYRRTVYHQNARAARVDLMTEFDSPDCALSAPRRASTTSPLQALTLMNHSFTMDMAGFLAKRMEQVAEDEGESARIGLAFELAFGRLPKDEELSAAAGLIEEHGRVAFCRAILNANELIYLN